MIEAMRRVSEAQEKRPIELRRMFDIGAERLKKLYLNTRRERARFEKKNIGFNLDVWDSLKELKNRKLKAFVVAHIYVAWYEWIKRLFNKIYRARFGRGPVDDRELLGFLDAYPTLKRSLDTTDWGVTANQIRNCVSHERFYFDYRSSELVFMTRKEKRVRLRDLWWRIHLLAHLYVELIRYLDSAVATS